ALRFSDGRIRFADADGAPGIFLGASRTAVGGSGGDRESEAVARESVSLKRSACEPASGRQVRSLGIVMASQLSGSDTLRLLVFVLGIFSGRVLVFSRSFPGPRATNRSRFRKRLASGAAATCVA